MQESTRRSRFDNQQCVPKDCCTTGKIETLSSSRAKKPKIDARTVGNESLDKKENTKPVPPVWKWAGADREDVNARIPKPLLPAEYSNMIVDVSRQVFNYLDPEITKLSIRKYEQMSMAKAANFSNRKNTLKNDFKPNRPIETLVAAPQQIKEHKVDVDDSFDCILKVKSSKSQRIVLAPVPYILSQRIEATSVDPQPRVPHREMINKNELFAVKKPSVQSLSHRNSPVSKGILQAPIDSLGNLAPAESMWDKRFRQAKAQIDENQFKITRKAYESYKEKLKETGTVSQENRFAFVDKLIKSQKDQNLIAVRASAGQPDQLAQFVKQENALFGATTVRHRNIRLANEKAAAIAHFLSKGKEATLDLPKRGRKVSKLAPIDIFNKNLLQ